MSGRIEIDETILEKYSPGKSLADKSRGLLAYQKESWDLCRKNYEALDKVQTKDFDFGNFKIKVQFNSGRIISSSAKVDTKSIEERKCFLCQRNLPEDQKGIPYYKNYTILCNPFPIFPEHFTIAKNEHIPQAIKNSFASMLELTRDLGKNYLLFYNGPKCGASAPDHLHFQAGSINFMEIDNDLPALFENGYKVFENSASKISAFSAYLRYGFIFKSNNKTELVELFNKFYETLKKIIKTEEEPMINILAYYSGSWQIVVFPRRLHRPSQYFEEGEKRILFSPASVDFGGVLITPREEDFNKITKNDIENMLRQVSISAEQFEFLTHQLKRNLVL